MSSLCPNPYLEEFLAEQQRYPADISKVFSVNLVKKRRKKLFQFIDRAADIAEKYGWCIPDERLSPFEEQNINIAELWQFFTPTPRLLSLVPERVTGALYFRNEELKWLHLIRSYPLRSCSSIHYCRTEFLQKIVSVR